MDSLPSANAASRSAGLDGTATFTAGSTSSRSSSFSQATSSTETADNGTYDPSDLEKATTAQSAASAQRVSRVQSLANRHAHDAAFTHPLAHARTAGDVLVRFSGPDDPYRPLNWPLRKKLLTTLLYGLTTMGATLASSVYAPAVVPVSAEFDAGHEVSLLGLSMLLLGFGFGPLLWGPVSEIYGRKPAVLLPYFVGAVFSFATGAAKDLQTVLITRFFAGLFASAPVTNTGGVMADIWTATERAKAIAFYAFVVLGGPILGPIIGGAFVTAGVTWRWTEYLTGIYMMVMWTLGVLILDETYAPVLLVYKARRLRITTGNWALHAPHEEWDPSIKELAKKFGVRPFQMLLTPICFLITLYNAFVYGILYGNFAGFPIVFEQERGWNPLVGSLPFLGLLLGIFAASCAHVYNQKLYNKKFEANGNKPVPEARLIPMMFGSFFFVAGMFIFGWTSGREIHWIAPVIGTVLLGFGFVAIFQSGLNYLIDTFTRYSASAVAANTFMRSVFATGFPLFIDPMYTRLGIPWASSVFGFFAVLLIPVPFLFYMYGPSIRKRGKYSGNMN